MKKLTLLLVIAMSSYCAYAQWAGPVNGVLTTSNYVGIGISNPLQKFTIKSLGTLTGSSSTDFDFGITDGAYAPMQLMGLVNTTGQYGLLQVVHGGVGAGNLVLQSWGVMSVLEPQVHKYC